MYPNFDAASAKHGVRYRLEFIFFQCEKLTLAQSPHHRSNQSPSIKQASSPGKTCASSYERNSTNSLSQQLAVSYQFDASGNRVQVSNAPAGGAAAEIGRYSYDAAGRMLSGRDDKGKLGEIRVRAKLPQ